MPLTVTGTVTETAKKLRNSNFMQNQGTLGVFPPKLNLMLLTPFTAIYSTGIDDNSEYISVLHAANRGIAVAVDMFIVGTLSCL